MKNHFHIFNGVHHVDISTTKHPQTVMTIDPSDWFYLERLGVRSICCQGRYAVTMFKGKVRLIHRLIRPNLSEVTHIDGNGLNNCGANLRESNRMRSTSEHPGVSWWNQKNRWRVIHKGRYVGIFKDEQAAAQAWRDADEKEEGKR